jgi:hypothetical protein
MPGFMDLIGQVWAEPSSHTQPVHIFHHKLKQTAKKLRTWSKGLFSGHKQQLIMGLDIILQLDIAQESRTRRLAKRLFELLSNRVSWVLQC